MTQFSEYIVASESESECSKRGASRNGDEEEGEERYNSIEEGRGGEEIDPEEEEVLESRSGSELANPKPGMQRYLVAVQYIGTRFSGSQKQLTCRTVVGVLEEAFCKFVGQPVSISLSSRTDAGVHAVSNVCHIDVERISKRKPGEVSPPHEPNVVRRAVNHFLQAEGDIMVTDVRCVPGNFHARFNAQERMYLYRVLSGPEPLSVFEKERAWHVPEELDLHSMQEACKILVGPHDFSSFRASGCQARSSNKTLDELHVSEVVSTAFFPSVLESDSDNILNQDAHVFSVKSGNDLNGNKLDASNGGSNIFGIRKSHRCFVFRVRARSFLYHQVRLMVGVLKAVGTGELTVADVKRILEAKTVTAASPMAPACGLYLGYVRYDLPQDEQAETTKSSETSLPASRKRCLS